jgi:hypothetical protein
MKSIHKRFTGIRNLTGWVWNYDGINEYQFINIIKINKEVSYHVRYNLIIPKLTNEMIITNRIYYRINIRILNESGWPI